MKKTLLTTMALASMLSFSFSQSVLTESFDSGLPGTWTQTTNATDGGWVNGTAATLSSTSFPFSDLNGTKMMGTNDDACNCDKSADRLISPSMDFTTGTNFMLSVDYFFAKGSYQGSTESGSIEISTDGGTSWNQLVDLTAATALEWRSASIDLSAYAGQSDVKISFLYNDNGGWLFGYGIDNFNVYMPQPDDAILVSTTLNRYSLSNINNTLSMEVKNNGSTTISSLDVDWNDGTAHTATISTNIAPGATASVNHTIPVNYAATNTFDIDVDITLVNSNADPNPNDNTGSTIITTLSSTPDKYVVIEEGTGTWCGWCPRGAVAMEYMYNNYPDFIGIAVHNGDPMTVNAYDAGAGFTGFPGCNVDRVILGADVGSSQFENYYNQRKNLLTPVSVSGTVTSNGLDLTIDASATFYSNFSNADYRLGVIMVENNVTGTSSGYNQSNYYSSQSQNMALTGAGHNWQQEPSTVPASDMEYDEVGRALLGGYNGQAGSIPAAIVDGQVYNYTFNYTIPAAYKKNDMHAVIVVIDNVTGEILNAFKTTVASASVSHVKSIDLTVFPNPASDEVNLTFEAQGVDYLVQITDLQGRVVLTENYSNLTGAQSISLNTSSLKTGNYLISVAQDGGSFTKMISIK